MRRRLIITAVALAALWAAPAAGAKGGVEKLQVCGQDGGCAAVAIRDLQGPRGFEILLGGAPRGTAPDHGPFYLLNATLHGGSKAHLFYVPGGGVTDLQAHHWWQLPTSVAAAIERAAATIEPLRYGGIVRVTVDNAAVDDPAAYHALFTELPAAALSDSQVDRRTLVTLSVENDAVSPWTGSRYHFALYDPGHHAVQVSGSDWLVAPPVLRAAIERDAGLSSPTAANSGGRDIPAAVYPAALAAVLALAALAMMVVRRRRHEYTPIVKEES
jgi:hypothetical protein